MTLDLKVAVITGITGALGKGIFHRLVNEFPAIKIYGTARSSKRAGEAFSFFIEEDIRLSKRIENKNLILIPAEFDTMVIKKVQVFSQLLHQE
ncbi:hypothetical protein DSO57_1029846 [Entomophthora muscae]|uniref:Uncharacterized protein n=1 Tax=Entomophthora muscae TaxID=34485 RepID=A0ACC2RFV0_9FUNG|nr:hypothetical protein DSO57_1029846 [Entomophthora muscae]